MDGWRGFITGGAYGALLGAIVALGYALFDLKAENEQLDRRVDYLWEKVVKGGGR